MLKVRVIEAKRNALRELGVQAGIDELTGPNGFLYMSEDSGRSQSPFGTASILFGNRGQYGAIIRALETEGLVNTLAEPNLTAISGETAGFLAGGEYPVPTGRDQDGNATLEFKQFGVSLNFTPTVMSRDRIALHLSTEVSEKDRNNGVELLDTQIDGLSVRRAETTVELASGGTIMIAGLIKSDTLQSMNGLPGVQDLPIIGQLFKSRSFSRGETELVIMVTPYLVNAYADPQAVVERPAPVPAFANRAIENRQSAVAPAPVATAPAPRAAAAPAKVLESKPVDTPLSRRLMANLKRTYGENRVSGGVGTGQAFGYIVD